MKQQPPATPPRAFRSLKPQWRAAAGDYITALAWSPREHVLAAATGGGPVVLLRASDGKPAAEIPGHTFGTLAASFAHDGSLLATGGQERSVRLWDGETGAPGPVIDSGAGSVERLAWSPTQKVLAIAAGKKLGLYGPDGELVRQLPDAKFAVNDIKWSRDGNHLAAVSYDGVRIFVLGKEEPLFTYPRQVSLIAMAWSPNHSYLVAGAQDGVLLVLNIEKGEDFMAGPYPVKVRELAFDHQSRYLATGGGADVVIWDFWNIQSENSRPIVLSAHQDTVEAVAWEPRTGILATAGRDNTVFFWWLAAGEQLPFAYGESQTAFTRIAWKPAGKQLATGDADGGVAMWGY